MARLQLLFLTALSSAASVLAQELPQLGISIAPIYDDDAVKYLNITLHMQDTGYKANNTMLSFGLYGYLTPEQQYDGDALTATDDQGVLPICYTDSDSGERHWRSSRDPVGEIVVNFVAEPRDKVSGVAGRNDLRLDQGGAIGQGAFFIPRPESDGRWAMTLNWDIPQSAPEGTRFASSWGDVQGSSATGYPDQALDGAYFAVGKLQRLPAWDDSDNKPLRHRSNTTQEFGMYWIGELPWDTTRLASMAEDLYRGIAKYFGDDESDFRVFYRHDFEAFGGSGGYKSFILEYTEGSEEEHSDKSIHRLLSHETIHIFALTNPSRDYDKWFVEGGAEYLMAVAPYTAGTINKTIFTEWLNNHAQDYYTSSPLSITWDKVVANYWGQGSMVVKLPYARGCLYLAHVQGLIAKATNNEHNIDEIIVEMYRMYIDGKKVQTLEFLSLLGDIIGEDEAQASFDAFSNGKTLYPDPDAFAYAGLKMVKEELEEYDLGFREGSLGEGEITELDPDSRAAKAGVRNGDKVVSSWGVFASSDTFDGKMRVVVDRNGTEQAIEWWPRGYNKVESWKWIDLDSM